MKEQEEIAAALKLLGVSGKVRIKNDGGRARVYVNGKYFGTFDFEGKTFVD